MGEADDADCCAFDARMRLMHKEILGRNIRVAHRYMCLRIIRVETVPQVSSREVAQIHTILIIYCKSEVEQIWEMGMGAYRTAFAQRLFVSVGQPDFDIRTN